MMMVNNNRKYHKTRWYSAHSDKSHTMKEGNNKYLKKLTPNKTVMMKLKNKKTPNKTVKTGVNKKKVNIQQDNNDDTVNNTHSSTKQGSNELVSWYSETSQPQKVISGLKTNFNLSPNYSAQKSSNNSFSELYKISPEKNVHET